MDSTAQTPYTDTARTDRGHYDGFELMPLAGHWRQGRSSKRIEDVDPYRGDTFLTLAAASTDDVDLNVAVNAANSPFGGEKQSGYGRFGGVWALHEFTTEHWIAV